MLFKMIYSFFLFVLCYYVGNFKCTPLFGQYLSDFKVELFI